MKGMEKQCAYKPRPPLSLDLLRARVRVTLRTSRLGGMECCRGDAEGEPRPRTMHIALGYFFILNYCLGTGFLGVPYSFFYSGYLAAIPTLALTGFLTWLTAAWLLEVMARAQVSRSNILY